MTINKSTPESRNFQSPIVKSELNSRVHYFRSIGGTMVIACFDSIPVEDNPYFIEIDRIEYDHLCKELQS